MENIKDMKLINISPKNWSKKHNLSLNHKIKCVDCGRTVVLDKPAESCGYVGFVNECVCDTDFFEAYFEPSSEKKKKFWKKIKI